MSLETAKRDRTVHLKSPGREQDLRATREGASKNATDSCDDNTNVFDGGYKEYFCRDSFLKSKLKKAKELRKKRRNKKKCRKKDVTIGTWNMQTMLDDGHMDLAKLDLLLDEMDQEKINILGLCEIRWSKEGKFSRGDHTVIYSGNAKGGDYGIGIILDKKHAASLKSYNCINDRIMMIKLDATPMPLNIIQVYAPTSKSTEEEIEKFYNDLQTVKDKIPSREQCIVMGDLNAKVGEGADLECGIGLHGHGKRNARGEMLAAFCKANSLTITNTLFSHPQRRRYTWISPLDTSRHQIDYIMVNSTYKNTVINSRSRPGADADTDHMLVTAKLRLKAIKSDKSEGPIKFNIDKLKDPVIKQMFEIETQNRFDTLLKDWSLDEVHPNEIWEDMKKAYLESAETVLGRKEKKKG